LNDRGEREAKAMRTADNRGASADAAGPPGGTAQAVPAGHGDAAGRARQLGQSPLLGRRLKAIDAELTSEPARVREVYRVARRVEPVGLVYLWPVTG
jgi:hypothetical protein